MKQNAQYDTAIPTRWVGPLRLSGEVVSGDVSVPLATYEKPLWPSTSRGARISRHCEGGIQCTVIDERMSRSIALRASSAQAANKAWLSIVSREDELCAIVESTSRFTRLLSVNKQIVGNLLFIRFECLTGDAAGHNMVTAAADALQTWLLEQYSELAYASISGNYCTDKKVSAVNAILGRGKNVIAEIEIPEALCQSMLRTTPEAMVRINTEKNLIGGTIAGSIRSANAHFANMLLGFFLATGQDAANIVEGSQGIVHAEKRDQSLYFSCTLPNLIVGSVGNGKSNPQAEEAMQKMGCREKRDVGDNGRRLAALCAATVLCGELSLLASQTNPGELMRTHLVMERA